MESTLTNNQEDIKSSVESALKASIKIIEYGGSTAFADKAFQRIISKCAVTNVSIMWRIDDIIVNYSADDGNVTIMKSIEGIGTNLTGVSKIVKLSEDVEQGKIDISSVDDELDKISKLPPLLGKPVLVIVAGFAAAFYALFHNESIETTAVVFFAAIAGQTLRLQLKAKKVKDEYVTLYCGLLSASITSIALHRGYGQVEIQTMIACLIYLVPGLLMINAFVDMTEQKFIFIGAQRIINATFLFLVLMLVIVTAYTFLKF